MRIAEAAVAALGDAAPLAGSISSASTRLLVLGQHLGAGRHLDHDVLAGRAGAVLAHAAAAALGLEVLAEAVVDERVEVGDAFHPHVAALAAVAAVGAAELDELLAPERDAPVAAVAGRDVDLGLVEEFSWRLPHAPPSRPSHTRQRAGTRVSRDPGAGSPTRALCRSSQSNTY